MPGAAAAAQRPEFRYARFLALLDEPLTAARQMLVDFDMGGGALPALAGGAHAVHADVYRHGNYSSLADTEPFRYSLKEHHLDLLMLLARAGRWERAWALWKRLPLAGVHRDADYYKLVLVLVALARDQKNAVYAARMYGAEAMAREVPRVRLDSQGIAGALVRVIQLAELGGGEEEFREVKRRCFEIMAAEKR